MARPSISPLVAIACLLAPLSLQAQSVPMEGTVTGMGSSSIEKRAETMRLQVDLQVEGSNLKDALDKLKTRRDAIKAGMVKIGATEATFEASDARLVEAEGGNNRAAMERMIRDRMQGRGGTTQPSGPKTVSVTCNIKVDFPLKGATAEEQMVAAGAIRDQVKSSKLLEVPKSAAQEEAAAEATAEFSNSDQPPANEPMYLYIAKVTEAEQTKATADAFAKAKVSATRLAKAAGSELGALRSLNSTAGDAESMYQDYYGGGGNPAMRYYYQRMMSQRARGSVSDEVISPQPGKVTQDVYVQANFAIK